LGFPLAAHLRVKSFPFRTVTLPTRGIAWIAGGTKTSIWKINYFYLFFVQKNESKKLKVPATNFFPFIALRVLEIYFQIFSYIFPHCDIAKN
jgi:hypothetical protein